jgi:hypothetical protein
LEDVVADVAFPELPLRDVPLVPIADETKGFASRDTAPISVLRIGGPAVFTVDGTPNSAVDDKDIVQYLKDHTDERFWMVHLAASFQPDGGSTIVRAWLRVQLSGSAGAAPVAWSLNPLREDTSTDVTTSLKLGADVKFATATLSPSVGADIKRTITEPLLLGMNELCPDPYWQFQTTKSEQLAGTFRCSLIVKTVRGGVTDGAVSLEANVERKAMGIIPYQTDPPDPSTLTFTLK